MREGGGAAASEDDDEAGAFGVPAAAAPLFEFPGGELDVWPQLDGEATFYDSNDVSTVVRCGEGILMPAGTRYRFVTTGDGPAVVLRIGGTTADGWAHYLDGNGDPLVLNPGTPRAVQAEGQFWTINGVSKE